LIAILLGFGVRHYPNDALVRLYKRRDNGVLEPEAWWIVILAAPYQWAGLILFGISL
jgi:hypothetical protein